MRVVNQLVSDDGRISMWVVSTEDTGYLAISFKSGVKAHIAMHENTKQVEDMISMLQEIVRYANKTFRYEQIR